MKKKLPKPLIITLIVAAALAILYFFGKKIVVFLAVFAWFSVLFLGQLLNRLDPPPPSPQISYAEFPIELVYEIDGKQYEIKDTMICEQDGYDYGADGLSDKERAWTMRFESGKDDIIIYDDGETVIYWKFSTAATYMGDPESWRYDEYYDGELEFYTETEIHYDGLSGSGLKYTWFTPEDLFENFGIVIIEYKIPYCIENSFSYLNYFR